MGESPLLVVTIDGPAGVGKSSIARRLAADLGWAYLDSGALYRAVALAAETHGVDLDDGAALATLAAALDLHLSADGRVRMGDDDVTASVRGPAATRGVSRVATVPGVRDVMLAHQRRFAAENGCVVAEGRDTGTVVFPDASVKIFLDARPEERARRRFRQEDPAAPHEGEAAGIARVEADLAARDARDRARSVAPLVAAEDAWRLDTSDLTLDEVFAAVRSHVRSRIPAVSPPESPA